jgi:D-aminopeptidase
MAKKRARELGIPLDGKTGSYNAITDVSGVLVGQSTLIEGESIRTGVTMIMPRGKTFDPVFAAWYALNGNGEMTGTTWIDESGFMESPIGITNTHSVGVVHDAIIQWEKENKLYSPVDPEEDTDIFWSLPVVAETYDGFLNDINGFHVKPEHVFAALDKASSGAVEEGCVGGGTGMICHEFKGGIGTSSRITEAGHTVGVLVQANYGLRRLLTIAGVPVGKHFTDTLMPKNETGSIIVIVATDAPLLPHQLKRVAQRVPMGLAKLGSIGGNSSGDIFLAFSTANPTAYRRKGVQSVEMLSNDEINPVFEATIQATEEAILNAMCAAETMVGYKGRTVYALPQEDVLAILKQYGR